MGREVRVYSLNATEAIEISSEGIIKSVAGIWFLSDRKYYAAGSGIYTKHSVNDQYWERQEGITEFRLYDVKGQSINDLIMCGALGEIIHYNGKSWKSFR